MKKIVLLFIFSLSCLRFVGATGQCGEVIIIGRDTLQLLACPIGMDSVLSGMVNERTDKDGFCTGCWRGYVGWWRLENNTLYLEKLVDYHRSSEDKEVCIDTEGIFDAYKQDGKIVASWFSGELRVVKGECISYAHMGFARDYEREWVYQVEQGKVVSLQTYHNILKETAIPAHKAIYWIADLFNGDRFPELKDKHLYFKTRIIPREDGSIDSLDLETCVVPSDSALHEYKRNWKWVKNDFTSPYVRELKTCLELIPGWEYLLIQNEVQACGLIWEIAAWKGRGCKANDERNSLKFGADFLSWNDTVYRLREHPLQYDMNLFSRLYPLIRETLSSRHLWKYTARWKIRDSRLYLQSVHQNKNAESIPLSSIFSSNSGEPVEAFWYTGKLLLQREGQLGQGFPLHEIYRKEIECEIEKGKVIKRTVYNNFFKKGDSSSQDLCEKKISDFDWWEFPDLKNKQLWIRYVVSPLVDGSADSIHIEIRIEEESRVWEQVKIEDPQHPYVQICRQMLEEVSSWDVLFARGEVRVVNGLVHVKRPVSQSEK